MKAVYTRRLGLERLSAQYAPATTPGEERESSFIIYIYKHVSNSILI